MAKSSLRTLSISCLAIWAGVWLLFLVMRLTSLDIRGIPGVGMVMLAALGVALVAPLVATGLAGAALLRQPRLPLDWVTLGGALAVLFGQGLLSLVTGWQ